MTNVYLKVKIKSLAVEANIIRHEERRYKLWSEAYCALHYHRVGEVRTEARSALLAYGFLRGRKYTQMEAKCHERPNWTRVRDLLSKYGGMTKQEADGVLKLWADELPIAA